jgi:hypothetical protein
MFESSETPEITVEVTHHGKGLLGELFGKQTTETDGHVQEFKKTLRVNKIMQHQETYKPTVQEGPFVRDRDGKDYSVAFLNKLKELKKKKK